MGWFDKIFKKGDAVVADPAPKDDDIAKYDDIQKAIVGTPTICYHGHDDTDASYCNEEAKIVVVDAPGEEEKQQQEKPIPSLDLTKIKVQPAANQSRRKDIVRGITLHHIMMGSYKRNVDFLASKESGVSAHYVLGRNAELTNLVDPDKKAWHAGVSRAVISGVMRSNLNNCMVGIEIVNPGYLTEENGEYYYNCGGKITKWTGENPEPATIVYPDGHALTGYCIPYTEKQLSKLVALCKALVEKYPEITRDSIVTHYEIAFPYGRKNDPWGLDVDTLKDKIFS